MKLNEKGLALAKVWQAKWDKAIELDSVANGGKGEEGWSVVYDYCMVKTVEDNIGIMLAAYEGEAISQELLYMDAYYDKRDGKGRSAISGKPYVRDETGNDVTRREYITAMCEYFDLSSEDRAFIDRCFTSKVKVRPRCVL